MSIKERAKIIKAKQAATAPIVNRVFGNKSFQEVVRQSGTPSVQQKTQDLSQYKINNTEPVTEDTLDQRLSSFYSSTPTETAASTPQRTDVNITPATILRELATAPVQQYYKGKDIAIQRARLREQIRNKDKRYEDLTVPEKALLKTTAFAGAPLLGRFTDPGLAKKRLATEGETIAGIQPSRLETFTPGKGEYMKDVGAIIKEGSDIGGWYGGGKATKMAVEKAIVPGVKGFINRAIPNIGMASTAMGGYGLGESLEQNKNIEDTAKNVASKMLFGATFAIGGQLFVDTLIKIAGKALAPKLKPDILKYNKANYDNEIDFAIDSLGFSDIPSKTKLNKRAEELLALYNPQKYPKNSEARTAATVHYNNILEAKNILQSGISPLPSQTPKGTAPISVVEKPLEDVIDAGTVVNNKDVENIRITIEKERKRIAQLAVDKEIEEANNIAKKVTRGEISVNDANKQIEKIRENAPLTETERNVIDEKIVELAKPKVSVEKAATTATRNVSKTTVPKETKTSAPTIKERAKVLKTLKKEAVAKEAPIVKTETIDELDFPKETPSRTYKEEVASLGAEAKYKDGKPANQAAKDLKALTSASKRGEITPETVITKDIRESILSEKNTADKNPNIKKEPEITFIDKDGNSRTMTEAEFEQYRANNRPTETGVIGEKPAVAQAVSEKVPVIDEWENIRLEDQNIPEVEKISNDLEQEFKLGKDEDYFIEKYNKYLNEGNDDAADIVDSFIQDNFRDGSAAKMANDTSIRLQSTLGLRELGKTILSINDIDKLLNYAWRKSWGFITQKFLPKGTINGLKNLGVLLSNKLSIKAGDKGIFYPFEYLFGTYRKKVFGPAKQRMDEIMASVSWDAKDLGDYFRKFSTKEQKQIVDIIESQSYDESVLGRAARYIEDKFALVSIKLVDSGLMDPRVAMEYWNKYFPRRINDKSGKLASMPFGSPFRLQQDKYSKVRHDKYGVTYTQGKQRQVQKFETEAERDKFVESLSGARNIQKFSPATAESVEKAGGYKNPLVAMVETYYHELKDVSVIKFLDEISTDERMFKESEDVANGFTHQIPDTKEWGAVRGMWANKRISNDIANLHYNREDADAIVRWLNEANGYIKGFKTILDPGVAFTNAVSNIGLLDLAQVKSSFISEVAPETLKESLGYLFGKKISGDFEHLVRKGAIGKTYAQQEVTNQIGADQFQKLQDLLVLPEGKSSPLDIWRQMGKEIVPLLKYANKRAGDFYSFAEDFSKTIAYKHAKRVLKLSDTEAINFAQDALFDYSMVSPLIKMLRTSLLGSPFPTFVTKMTKKIVEQSVKNPFTIAKWMLMIGAAQNIALRNTNVNQEDMEKLKPSYLGDFTLMLDPARDEEGNITKFSYLDLSRMLPIGQLLDLPTPEKTDTLLPKYKGTDLIPKFKVGSMYYSDTDSGILSAFKPGSLVVPALMNLSNNMDTFTGKEIYNKRDPLYKQTSDQINYITTKLLPSWFPGGTMYDKLDKAGLIGGVGILDKSGNSAKKKDAILRLFGSKIVEIIPEEILSYKLYDLKKELQKQQAAYKSTVRYSTAVSGIESGAGKRTAEIKSTETKKIKDRIDKIVKDIKETLDFRDTISDKLKAPDGYKPEEKSKSLMETLMELVGKPASAAEFDIQQGKTANPFTKIVPFGQLYEQPRKETFIGDILKKYPVKDGKYADNQDWFIDNIGLSSYATSKQHRERLQNVYETTPEFNSATEIKEYLKNKYPKSPVINKVDAIYDAARYYDINPRLIVSVARQDSSMGTKGRGSETMNIGNVGNTENRTTRFNSWEEGIIAMIRNLAERKAELGQSSRY